MSALRHVALLRGINVGRAKRVAMADLRALVEGLGYGEVRTLLNSGNVVFAAPAATAGKAAARIEKGIAADLGVSCRVTVLTGGEIAEIVAKNPLEEIAVDPSRYLVAVLNDPADRTRLAAIAQQDWAPEVMAIGRRVAYVWCASGILAGRLFQTIDKALGGGVTTRNWATITKLHALTEEATP